MKNHPAAASFWHGSDIERLWRERKAKRKDGQG
jgi:hypothetical protein